MIFDHENMGFGKVVTKEQELIDIIKIYLSNDCQMETLFSNRARKFYPLHDTNNCERIYQAIMELP